MKRKFVVFHASDLYVVHNLDKLVVNSHNSLDQNYGTCRQKLFTAVLCATWWV